MFEPLLLAVLLAQSVGAQSAPAVLQPGAEVLQGEWEVEVIDRIEVMPESQVTVRFQGTRVTGMASCNTYQGTADIQGTALTFRGILATMKFCDGPRMSQEKDFLELLRTAVRYELLSDGVLAITDARGKTITARRKPAS